MNKLLSGSRPVFNNWPARGGRFSPIFTDMPIYAQMRLNLFGLRGGGGGGGGGGFTTEILENTISR